MIAERPEHICDALPSVEAFDIAILQQRIGAARSNQARIFIIELDELSGQAP